MSRSSTESESTREAGMLRNILSARRSLTFCRLRWYSVEQSQLTEGEKNIQAVLKTKFPTAVDVRVQDISGGCGSMYEIYVESEEFRGKRTILQHRMVNDALKEEIKDMHGLRISTKVPG